MLRLAAPAFLAAGALLALGPLLLHMLARTPPERRPLPTARFLEPDRRTQLRLRRPADLLLLALRMAFLVLLGAAFARPSWVAEREGAGRVVLLDAGADMAGAWEEAVAVASERLGEEGMLVVFDTAARLIEAGPAAVDSLRRAGPGEAPSSLLAGLRGLRLAAARLRVDSATAVLVTRGHWSAWSPAIPAVREAAWPARIELVSVGRPDSISVTAAGSPGTGLPADSGPTSGRAAVVGPAAHPLRPYVEAALVALGYEVGREDARVVVLLPDTPTGSQELAGAERVLHLGGSTVGAASSAWVVASGRSDLAGYRPPPGGRLVFPGGAALSGWHPLPGRPAVGARVAAAWEDGRPAAAVSAVGDGCVAYLAAEPVAPEAAADPGFPHLVRALSAACGADTRGTAGAGGAWSPAAEGPAGGYPVRAGDPLAGIPLDAGAGQILAGDTLPAVADLSQLSEAGGERGRSLSRLLLALALAAAVAEGALTYFRRVPA